MKYCSANSEGVKAFVSESVGCFENRWIAKINYSGNEWGWPNFKWWGKENQII